MSAEQALTVSMRDPEYDPDEKREYECFKCGTVVEARDAPESCPNCGEEMRNRFIPVE